MTYQLDLLMDNVISIEAKNKPVLIIGCSAAKTGGTKPAFDLYDGTMYQLIRSNLPDIHKHFIVLILSAKHGLIGAHDMISSYDLKMPSRKNESEISVFAEKHKNTMRRITELANQDRSIYTVLSNDYLCCFDKMVSIASLKKFKSHYESRGHLGIGVLRGRLNKILSTVHAPTPKTVLYRSGLANADEFIGLAKARANLGFSLAYVNQQKQNHLLKIGLESLASGKDLFVDNGIITKIGKGEFVDVPSVLDMYVSIINSLPKGASKNMAIVIPDNPLDSAGSLDIVRENKEVITWLSHRADVILPVHKFGVDIVEHALSMMEELNFPDVRLGIPCKKALKTETCSIDIQLSLSEIEALYSLKNNKGQRLFKKAHFFALTEYSRGNLLKQRELLSAMYDVKISADGCRTTAIMGNELTSDRIGSRTMRAIRKEVVLDKLQKDPNYSFHLVENEYDAPLVYERVLDLINTDVREFITMWNEVMENHWSIAIDDNESDEELTLYCEELFINFPRIIEQEMLDRLKKYFWSLFSKPEFEPSNRDKRIETFVRLFSDKTAA
ncbi:MAG: hypothetical protein HRU38_06885 [Saccharospirillaceae bacterium]|nr:hypothetical protein [Saccharospirillaceae bacterium]